jgi:hypothetical protein
MARELTRILEGGFEEDLRENWKAYYEQGPITTGGDNE